MMSVYCREAAAVGSVGGCPPLAQFRLKMNDEVISNLCNNN